MFNVGIEEEFFVIDPKSYELVSLLDETFYTQCSKTLATFIKGEFYDCQIELNTPVCKNIKSLRQMLSKMQGALYTHISERNLMLLATSTHPLAEWKDCNPVKGIRYQKIENELKDSVLRLLACSLQFHVEIPKLELRFSVINSISQYLPHLLALSSSSPFWEGRDTGLLSYRTPVLCNLPRSDLPPVFNSMADFEHYKDVLIKTNTIMDGKEIWWDIRPHPFFPTIECRICDNPTYPEDMITLTALFQALVAKSYKLLVNGLVPNPGMPLFTQENKRRASRYGLAGYFIDVQKEEEISVKDAICQLLENIDDVVDELDSREEINHIYTMMDRGTSADLQLLAYKKTGNIQDVFKAALKMQNNLSF